MYILLLLGYISLYRYIRTYLSTYYIYNIGDGEVIVIYILLDVLFIIIFNYLPYLFILLLFFKDVFKVYIVTSFIHIIYEAPSIRQ